jgi:hypothetical protein
MVHAVRQRCGVQQGGEKPGTTDFGEIRTSFADVMNVSNGEAQPSAE